jgi:sugar lactone lactonase YvrE
MVRTSTIIIRTIARIIAGAARISAIIFITVGAPLADPRGAALAQGDIFVADQSALGGQGAVIRIDPANGVQKSVAAGKLLIHPAGIAVDRSGRIFVAVPQKPGRIVKVDAVADRDALGGAGAIIRLDPRTGAQTVMSSGENLLNPTDVALDAKGRLLIADFNSFACGPGGYSGAGAGAILRFAILPLVRSAGASSRADPLQPGQSLVSCDRLFQNNGPYGIATETDGKILVTATTGDANPAGAPRRTPTNSYSYGAVGQVIRIDPATGAQTRLSSAGLLAAPIGIDVLRR